MRPWQSPPLHPSLCDANNTPHLSAQALPGWDGMIARLLLLAFCSVRTLAPQSPMRQRRQVMPPGLACGRGRQITNGAKKCSLAPGPPVVVKAVHHDFGITPLTGASP